MFVLQDGYPAPNRLAFQFPISDTEHDLQITTNDINDMKRLVDVAQLHQIAPQDVFAAFTDFQQHEMKPQAFTTRISRLIPAVPDADESFISLCLSRIFYAFDHTNNGTVNMRECVCGVSLLSSGPKSEKLGISFDWWDSDEDGFLSPEEFELYLGSYLRVLIRLTECGVMQDAETVDKLVRDTAAHAIKQIFAGVPPTSERRISFKDFGNWYSDGGFDSVGWLEMLDLRKWNISPASENWSLAATGSCASEGTDGHTETQQRFSFPLYDDKAMEMTRDDIAYMQRLTTLSGLNNYTPKQIHDMLSAGSEGKYLHKKMFLEAMKDNIPTSPDEHAEFVQQSFESMFHAYDYTRTKDMPAESVATPTFITGFSLLSSGSKSEKLAIAFELMSDHENGMTQSRLSVFLSAFLTILIAMSNFGKGVSASNFASVSQNACKSVADQIFSETSADDDIQQRDNDDVISFDEFARWYGERGFETLTWLELLDLRKWHFMVENSGD